MPRARRAQQSIAAPLAMTRRVLSEVPVRQAARLMELPVCRWISSGGGGSAVPLGPALILLCRHQIERGGAAAELDGVPVGYEVIATGDTTAPHDDWSLLRVKPPVNRWIAAMARCAAPAEGQRLDLVGFWHGDELLTLTQGRVLGRTLIAATVVAPPDGRDAPDPAAFILCRTGCTTALGGLSGGAAVMWSRRQQRHQLLGIYCGAWRSSGPGAETLHLVRRLPARVLEIIDGTRAAQEAAAG